ncbi:unnamed protein product [Rotaria sp. Silwood1]|nr:unnamed protein product [Rotaria sp. Silwood1]
MNSSTIALASQFNLVQTYLTRYFMVPIYIFGNLGNLLNIILFSQRNLRLNNVCAWYFIGLSLVNLLIIDTGGLSRSLPFLTSFNLETTSIIFCKCRLYFVHFSLILGRYFICLISIDRWMVTSFSQSIRQMSSPKFSRYLIIVGTCIGVIFSIHAPIGFEIKNNRCYAYLNTSYGAFFSFYNVLSILIPIIIMMLFSAFIISNIHQRHRRTQPRLRGLRNSQEAPVRATQHIDVHLIRLVLTQSLTFVLLNISFVAYAVYDFATSWEQKGPDRQVIEAFIYAMAIHPIYIFCSVR